MFRDSLVKKMALVAAIIILLVLGTTIAALLFGFLGNTAPRTMFERDFRLTQNETEAGSDNPEVWGRYAELLADDKQFKRAQEVLDTAKNAGIENPDYRFLDQAQARVYLAQEKYEDAIKVCDDSLKLLEAEMKKRKAEFRKNPSKPIGLVASGHGPPYFAMILVRAQSYEMLEYYEDAIESLSKYLDIKPTAADLLEWRGDLYLKSGNNKAATTDYKSALKFDPTNKELEAKSVR